MKKVIKIIVIILIIILLAAIIGAIYWFNGNIEAKPSEEKNYNIAEEKFAQRKVFVLTPKTEKSNKVILYLHGGAYVGEIEQEHWLFFNEIIKYTNATIIVPDYPLAPQYNYEDAINMVLPLYEKILEKVKQENLILMGDSAGAGMSLSLVQKIAEDKLIQPSKTILISPWLDVTMSNKEIDEVQKRDSKLNKNILKIVGIVYAKTEENTTNYLVSPIYGKLENLKNIVVYTGTNDILNPDVHILEQKLEDIKINEYEGAIHNWILEKYVDEKYNNELSQKAYENLIYESLKKSMLKYLQSAINQQKLEIDTKRKI